MGYFETRRDRARYATYRWLLRQQMWRHLTMPNPNPAQPVHEPVLQHVDPPDLYDLPEEHNDHYVTDENGDTWHVANPAFAHTTAGAAGEPADSAGNAIRGTEELDALEDEGRVPGDEWHVCESKAAEIRAEQERAQEGRHFAHVGDLVLDPGEEPAEYNSTDDAFVPADEETRITEGFGVEHRHDGGDWHSHNDDKVLHGEC